MKKIYNSFFLKKLENKLLIKSPIIKINKNHLIK